MGPLDHVTESDYLSNSLGFVFRGIIFTNFKFGINSTEIEYV